MGVSPPCAARSGGSQRGDKAQLHKAGPQANVSYPVSHRPISICRSRVVSFRLTLAARKVLNISPSCHVPAALAEYQALFLSREVGNLLNRLVFHALPCCLVCPCLSLSAVASVFPFLPSADIHKPRFRNNHRMRLK